ncbi:MULTISPECIES: hypothetical protein [unclassified Granulicatella]|uniref:hypothetical protein n=1 Tax=unclassified Granulicatella TaxID=2630493 RepID=UPI0010744CF5|nr:MULTISPECIES: hypothetical protein [unclassified Granulicatella]MBF0780502.1 hypothetical protein [Granulicatella sp. 19428wC4_WM01]TFU95318.1 hypothetical protein E4T68_05290 [Granulicatella sp. WM01]
MLERIIQLGALGILNYFILNRTDVINFNKNSQQLEKMAVVAFFTGLNYFIYDSLIVVSNIYLKMCIVFVVSFSITFYFVPFIKKKYISLEREKGYTFDNRTVKDRALSEYDNQPYIYVYNFNNELIEHGRLWLYANKSDEYNEIALVRLKGMENLTVDKLTEFYTCDIIIDVDKQLKMYIIQE